MIIFLSIFLTLSLLNGFFVFGALRLHSEAERKIEQTELESEIEQMKNKR